MYTNILWILNFCELKKKLTKKKGWERMPMPSRSPGLTSWRQWSKTQRGSSVSEPKKRCLGWLSLIMVPSQWRVWTTHRFVQNVGAEGLNFTHADTSVAPKYFLQPVPHCPMTSRAKGAAVQLQMLHRPQSCLNLICQMSKTNRITCKKG